MDTFWLAMGVAILGGTSIPVIAIWTSHKRELAEIEANKAAAVLSEENAKLAERLEVLERIVTDKGYQVSEEIKALPDGSQASETGSGVPLDTVAKEHAQ